MRTPLLGRVSTRAGARLHLDVLGRAHCGAGTGRIRGAGRELERADAPLVCRRCNRRLRELMVDAIAEANRRRGPSARARLADLYRIDDALRTPARVAADTATAAGIAGNIRAARVGELSGFGRFAAGHAAAIRADREEFNSGQLYLFAA